MWEEKSYALPAVFYRCIIYALYRSTAKCEYCFHFVFSMYFGMNITAVLLSAMQNCFSHIWIWNNTRRFLENRFLTYKYMCATTVAQHCCFNFLHVFWSFFFTCSSFKCADYKFIFSSELIWNWGNSFMLVLNRLRYLLSVL